MEKTGKPRGGGKKQARDQDEPEFPDNDVFHGSIEDMIAHQINKQARVADKARKTRKPQ